MKKTLLVLKAIVSDDQEKIRQLADGMEVAFCENENPEDQLLARASYIWGNPSPARLKGCTRLEWLQLQSAGFEAYTAPGVLPEGVALTNATGAYGETISEYLLATTLSLMKKLPLYRDGQLKQDWKGLGRIKMLSESRVLVVGVGDIGGLYAQKLRVLGASVSRVSRKPRELPAYLDALYRLDTLEEILPGFDIVALCLPNNPETAGRFSRACIGCMKPGALLLNIGRGNAVDTEALCDALESGQLGGAGLDVTDPEPLPANHRLWRIPTALVTPHVAGGDASGGIYTAIVDIWLENLARQQKAAPLLNLVNRETGYRE